MLTDTWKARSEVRGLWRQLQLNTQKSLNASWVSNLLVKDNDNRRQIIKRDSDPEDPASFSIGRRTWPGLNRRRAAACLDEA